MSAHPLDEPFLANLLKQEFVPINAVTLTDFIISGGITAALRRPAAGQLVAKLAKVPAEASIVLPSPAQALKNKPGELLLRDMIQAMLRSRRSERARLVVDDRPPEGLVDTIAEIFYLAAAADNRAKNRVTILAPSELHQPTVYTGRLFPDDQRRADMVAAVDPLLTLVPAGGTRLEPGKAAETFGINGYDYAILPNTFTAWSGGGPEYSVVDQMKALNRLEDQIRAFGVAPFPILAAINS